MRVLGRRFGIVLGLSRGQRCLSLCCLGGIGGYCLAVSFVRYINFWERDDQHEHLRGFPMLSPTLARLTSCMGINSRS